MNESVRQTLVARVYDVAKETPLQNAQKLSKELGFDIYLKREDLQPVHSFKLRGAYNKISQLTSEQRKRGIIAASAGNHAQGVALSAQKLGLSAVIVMPKTTPQIKIDAVKSYGAEVVLFGDNYSEAAQHSEDLVASSGRTYIHPFDDPLVISGQGTVGREILEQLHDVTHIFVPVGGGGLIAGIAQYVKQVKPSVKIVGVEPVDSAAMHESLKANKRVNLKHVGIFADGVAVKQVGKNTFALCRQFVDSVITVNTDEICAAIQSVFEETRTVVEPAGALSIAGTKKFFANIDKKSGSKVVAICSGANISFERLQFVAERTKLGSGKEALFAIELQEKPGALLAFCESVVNGYNITEFNYRINPKRKAHIFVGIALPTNEDKLTFISNLQEENYTFFDLSHEEVAKEHIRHMIGGISSSDNRELFYLIEFPERPGALSEFLRSMGDEWNISLFHYRGQGGDVGRVLIGYEATDKVRLENALKHSTAEATAVNTKGIQLFLRG